MKKIKKQILIMVVLLVVFILRQQFNRGIQTQQKRDNNIQTQSVQLLRVVDGDTLIVSLGGKRERVRLIGMDAPESVKPHAPVECFGKEASQHLKDLVAHKKIEFISDVSQDTRDRFGRLLGYVFADGKNLAETMIADGYAYEYTYRKYQPYKYQNEFQKAEKDARRNKYGLWADTACNGKKK